MGKIMLRLSGLFLALLLLFTYFATYIIYEGQGGLVLRSGERPIVLQPGIYFKLPFLYRVVKVDLLHKSTSLTSTPITTAKQEYVTIDYYVDWQIVNLEKYFATGPKADSDLLAALQKVIDAALQEQLQGLDLNALMTKINQDSNSWVLEKVQPTAANLGLAIKEIAFAKISFTAETQAAFLEKARAQYNDLLDQQHHTLSEQIQNMRLQSDAAAAAILSVARARAAQINADTLAMLANIYTPAYLAAADFFIWQHSLNLYKKSFSSGDNILLLKSEDELLQRLGKK